MKYVLVLLVVLVVGWLALGRHRRRGEPPEAAKRNTPSRPAPGAAPQAMVACAHCGVHLPAADALVDPQARRYCSESHRSAGPR